MKEWIVLISLGQPLDPKRGAALSCGRQAAVYSLAVRGRNEPGAQLSVSANNPLWRFTYITGCTAHQL